MGPSPAIEVLGVSHSYGERRALDGVEFSVEPGAIFGLLGPNGGGKTTLFRLLSTLVPIQQGRARILGFDLARDPTEVRKHIGVTFQSPSIDPKLTVGENLKYQGQIYGLSGSPLRQRIDLLTDKLGLRERLADRAETLSGGLKRRVEIAKGLLHWPQVLLLDEPSTGLDPGARHDLWRYLRGLREEDGVTVLVTTHLMEEGVERQRDRLGILDQGRLVALDTPLALRSMLGDDYVTVQCDEPDELSARIRERFGVTPQKKIKGILADRQEPRARVCARPGRRVSRGGQDNLVGEADARGCLYRADGTPVLGRRGTAMTATAAPLAELRNPSGTPGVRPAPTVGFWLPAWSLASRELVRFFRQRTALSKCSASPLHLLGPAWAPGLGGTFRAPAWAPAGMTYQEYFLPGVAVLIVLFTAIFSTISIRRSGVEDSCRPCSSPPCRAHRSCWERWRGERHWP